MPKSWYCNLTFTITTIFIIFNLLNLPKSSHCIRYGDKPELLHVDLSEEIGAQRKPTIITKLSENYRNSNSNSNFNINDEIEKERHKRDTTLNKSPSSSSVSGKAAGLKTPSSVASSIDGVVGGVGNKDKSGNDNNSGSNIGSAATTAGASSTIKPPLNNGNKHQHRNITVKTNHLNDSHAQLMVHWLGDGSDVMLCLARDAPAGPYENSKHKEDASPSSVYISYDYGNTFENKTHLFMVPGENGIEKNSTLDQFLTHPKYDTIIFIDSKNKVIFNVPDKGDNVKRYVVDFTPSDISFYESDPNIFLALDKEDPERKLYYTTDCGKTFTMLEMYVKSFSWSSGDGMAPHLYVERKEPITNISSVRWMNSGDLLKPNITKSFNVLIENVQDFHVKKSFMFAMRKVLNTTELYISYKRGRFVQAIFQTELDIKAMHIADVEGRRIMISAAHSEYISHLYVSENNNDMSEIQFVPSLENIFTYIPDMMWKYGWLSQTTDETFTDLYKVEGLRGIYIASKVNMGYKSQAPFPQLLSRYALFESVGPANLVSLISFDHGASWRRIEAPKYDDEGQPITNCTKDCSLHLSQKFSQVYPVTRAVSIMSSKLAPGIIMASGVIGQSLKGHPGVFLSRDAGLTWTQILKTYHFFNFGDHGGILVAVKYYKSKGETREILYTTDEGENWERYPFYEDNLKIYGLMTEPNSNTTIFTLFGSQKEEHQWLILKIDLKNAFERNCTEKSDYKFWAPSSQSGHSLMPCLLGKQQKFQRRIPHTNCFNGKDFQPEIKTEICLCNSWDFECDFDFKRSNTNSPCIFEKSIHDPYKIPSYCKPGGYYNRTRGYKKIEGDVCYGGYEQRYLPQTLPCPMKETPSFLLLAQRERISRIDINTQAREEIPIKDLKNVIAIDFDIKNNCVFFADIMLDKICRQCLDGNHTVEILVDSELSSVEGMSYDWISELLFFVDGTRSKIEAVKTSRDNFARMRTTVIDYDKLVKPRGIVVHPPEGLLFWTEWSTQKPSLSRSNLDGSDIRVLFSKPDVVWPNGVTIDYFSQRLYWVDASKDYIGSCDLNGKSFVKILEHDSRVAHPFAVAIYKDLMYWDDWKMNSIYSADKDYGIVIKNIAHQLSHLMDLKVYAHSLQEGVNGCQKNNCTHICVGAPKGEFSCLCPVGMQKSGNECLCPGGLPPFNNNTCTQQGSTCTAGFFKCETNKLCIPNPHRCDGLNDCGDNSDEEGCATENPPCPHYMFRCKIDNKCIPEYFVCDSEIDCDDGSDELGCTFNDCKNTEFKCNNGRCITEMWVCDGEDDCIDKSDEQHCKDQTNKTAVTCKPNEFRCTSSNQCVPLQWKCDNDHDCPDSSDELNCNQRECDMWEFDCGNGKCIHRSWKCDGERDCENNADEMNCTKTTQEVPGTNFFPSNACHDWMFKCSNDKCIPMWWKCDMANDCGDNSDEIGCSTTQNSTNRIGHKTSTPSSETINEKCPINNFQCNNGFCILKKYVCDGSADCPDGEDEENCSNITMEACNGPDQFRCKTDRTCLPISMYCDNIPHCPDGSDEDDCGEHPSRLPDHEVNCGPAYFRCDHTCIALMKRCDKKLDCYDGTDEEMCEKVKRVYQITNFILEQKFIEQTSFILSWWITLPPESNVTLEYLPSISLMDKNDWKNSTWITDKKFKFSGLTPYTNYNCTVYVRVKGEKAVPPYFFANITTSEGIPDQPLNVNVTQIKGSRVQVTWDPPKKTYGLLTAYTVYYRPQSMSIGSAQSVKVNSKEHSLILNSYFKSNITYEFWVRAKNSKEESLPSKMVQLTINDISNIDLLQGLTASISDSGYSITLKWRPVKGADGYSIETILPEPYPRIPSRKTNATDIKYENLAPGLVYIFKVSAYVKQFIGRAQSMKVQLKSPPLPEVANIHLENDSSYTRLKWIEPKTTLNNITYGVYYGTKEEEIFEGPKIKTQLTEVNITDLMPCQSYMISVGIIGPLGPGPLSHDPIQFETTLNDRKPPRNLVASIDHKTRRMCIEWDHNCALSKVFPAYLITVIETIKNQTSVVEIQRAANKSIYYSHYFNEIPYGAVYNISVRAKIDNSEPANTVIKAPELEGPRQLKVWPERNGTYVVYWKEFEKSYYNFKFTYELVIFDGHFIHDAEHNATEVKRISSNTPPIMINPDDLGGLDALGKIFTFGIRLKSDAGYTSNISEIEHIDIPIEAWHLPIVSETTYAWLIIIPIVLIISLAGVIVYLVQRHKRLQNSFSRFANSHYDTKTGATRIGTDVFDDDHHEHHQEVPRFADDDPLVI